MNFKNRSYRPNADSVKISDGFWSDHLDGIRHIMLPYVFEKFAEIGYLDNFSAVAEGKRGCHCGPPFADGLVFEAMRGAADFLADEYDPELEKMLDRLVSLTKAASDAIEDGYFNTCIVLDHPECRWGENGGDLVKYHDFYDQGALIEAAVSHYLATKKTDLLYCAVRAANNICKNVGEPPKKGVIPGHSLPEEAFVKLYRLFRDTRELDGFAEKNGVDREEYLRVAKFWYDARGKYTPEKEYMTPRIHYLTSEYYQNHLPFPEQRYATGHAVRAPLCYLGAAAVAFETGDKGYKTALDAIFDNIKNKNMHITGGIGARHEIEAFDDDYSLPNDAYLETCAAVGLAFFAGEMNLLDQDSMYFDVFERALYNNILSSVGSDFKTYFYQNPLENGGGHHRWSWHSCPCCPPMLLKIFSALKTYIYQLGEKSSDGHERIFVNMYIGSTYKKDCLELTQTDRKFCIDSHGERVGIHFRVPEYAKNFRLVLNERTVPFIMKHQGYALVERVWYPDDCLCVIFDEPIRMIAADRRVRADIGKIAVTKGARVFCAEGIDNGGDVGFTVAEDAALCEKDGRITGKRADGGEFVLIPFAERCNKGSLEGDDRAMRVWLDFEGTPKPDPTGSLYFEVK